MENLPTVFKPKQANLAEFIAYLTNSTVYKEENVIRLIGEAELKELITKKLEKKDFIGSSELFENAKKSLNPVRESAEIVSKSIRLSFITYLKLIEIAQKMGMSLSDTIRTTSVKLMKNKLDEFKDIQSIDQEKLKILYNLLQEWEDKKPTSTYKSYLPMFYYGTGNKISNLFEKFFELSIYEKCAKYKKYENYEFPALMIEVMKNYLRDNVDIDWESMDIDAHLEFDTVSNLFKLRIYHNTPIYLNKYKEFKETIDSNLHKKFDEILNFDINRFDDGGDSLEYNFPVFSGNFYLENNKLFFDSVDITQKAALNILIHEKITGEKYINFETAEYINQVHDALSKNDYNLAALLNEHLANFQVFQEISNWYANIILSITEESNVVTFTIPKLLLMLWEATKDDRSILEFIEQNLLEV